MGGVTVEFNGKSLARQIKVLEVQNSLLRTANDLKQKEIRNDFSAILQGAYGQANLTSFNELFQSNIYARLSLQYNYLDYSYATHPMIQTAIDMPVQEALRGGVEIFSPGDDMDEYDIQELQEILEEENILQDAIGAARSWARLFGGGALIVNTGGKLDTELTDKEKIHYLKFYPADRWELDRRAHV